MMDMREQIEQYLSLGFSLIPLQPRQKTPLVKWKTFKLSVLAVDYYQKKNANWAIRSGLLPSGDWLWFLDLDRKEMLGELYKKHPPLKSMPLVSTSHGWHLYGTWKTEPKTQHLDGVDIICNGYVVAPPSVHPDGHIYKWITPLKGVPPTYNPGWLVPEAQKPVIVAPAVSSSWETEEGYMWQDNYKGVSEGNRHNRLIQIIGALCANEKTEKQILDTVMGWNKRNGPPLRKEEIEETVESMYREMLGGTH